MILTTSRLIIRKFTKSDLDNLASLLANPEVMHFSVKGPVSKVETESLLQNRILDHYEKYEFGLWALINLEDQQFIGFAGLVSQVIDGKDEIELGYRLFPKYWGKGLATEAALGILDYAFKQLKLSQIISIIDPANKKSIQVAKKAGLSYWKDSLFHGTPVQIYVISSC